MLCSNVSVFCHVLCFCKRVKCGDPGRAVWVQPLERSALIEANKMHPVCCVELTHFAHSATFMLHLSPPHREDQHGLPLLPRGALPRGAVGDGERPCLPLACHYVL